MYYLYGEIVIIKRQRGSSHGIGRAKYDPFQTRRPVERRMYALISNLYLGLEIPMAVTSGISGFAQPREAGPSLKEAEASSG